MYGVYVWARDLPKQNKKLGSRSFILNVADPEPIEASTGADTVWEAGGGGVVVSDVVPSCSVTRQRAALLQVLEEASVAEVVDVSTEKHQFGVDVIGHTVVGGHCVAYSGWHNEGGGTVEHAVPTASHQGTKSEEGQKYRSGRPTGNIF